MKTRADAIIELFKPTNDTLIGAEIGVYKGSMSRMLLNGLPKLSLFMIDRWQAYSEDEMKANKNSSMSLRKQKTFDRAYEKVHQLSLKFKKRCFVFRKDSVSAAYDFANNTFDFVFIDADHSYDAVINDIRAWEPKIKGDGYICGHDYHRESVKNAVNDIFRKNSIKLSYDNTWIVKI